MGQNDHNIT